MNFKLTVILSFVFSSVNSSALNFKRWQEKFNITRLVNDSEYNKFRQTFDVSVSFVTVNKLRYRFGYELGLNGLADVPFDQFQKNFNGLILPNKTEQGDIVTNYSPLQKITGRAITSVVIPNSVDYRNYSLPVQNQRICNSCWAFSVVAALGAIFEFLM